MTRANEAAIDALYALPLAEFVTARQALAKTLKGEDARKVKALAKPTTIPWIVNQLKWHEPRAYDQALTSGAAVRLAQIAALEGRGTTLRDASATHRRALTDATQAGVRLAAALGIMVDPDAVSRMLETVSLAEQLPEAHGRFTTLVQPAGFEALMGVTLSASADAGSGAAAGDARTGSPSPSTRPSKGPTVVTIDAALADAAERVERERRDAREQRARAIAEAEVRLAVARQHEVEARDAWHRAKDAVDAARHAVDTARRAT